MARNKKSITPEYETLALADSKRKDKKTNMSMPSLDAVKAAKDWVDDNPK